MVGKEVWQTRDEPRKETLLPWSIPRLSKRWTRRYINSRVPKVDCQRFPSRTRQKSKYLSGNQFIRSRRKRKDLG